MKSDVIHCKNYDIIVLNGKVVETKPECYMKFFRGNILANELVEKILNLRKVIAESGFTDFGYEVPKDLFDIIERGELNGR